MRVSLLPDFYQTDFNDLPAPVEMKVGHLVIWLRKDNKRGAVVAGPTPIAVWTGNEDGADAAYYTQPLPLEEPDANWEGTAAQAVRSAMEQTALVS